MYIISYYTLRYVIVLYISDGMGLDQMGQHHEAPKKGMLALTNPGLVRRGSVSPPGRRVKLLQHLLAGYLQVSTKNETKLDKYNQHESNYQLYIYA